jgi:predicted dehydrogenase
MIFLVAGTGSIGKRHIYNIRKLQPDAIFILLRTGGREDDFSIGLPAFTAKTFDQAMARSPDAIIIATPSALHHELIQLGIAAGLPMYIEKPVVTCGKDGVAVRQAIATHSYSAPTLAGCNLRFLPSLLTLRRLMGEGVIGRVVRASFEAGQWLPDWRPCQDHRQSYSADPVRGGGVVFDLVHELDAARWLVGEMTIIKALTAQVPTLEITSEAAAGAVMYSEGGVIVSLGLDYVARYPLRRYQFVGERGTLVWDLPARTLHLDNTAGRAVIDCGEQGFDVAATYLSAMTEFLAGLASGAPTSQPIEEGLASAELAIRIKELT